MEGIPKLIKFIIYVFLSVFIAVYSIETFTMLGPVNPGTNRLSCLPLQKAQELKKEVLSISWFKLQLDDVNAWAWIGGIRYSDNQSEPSVNDGFDKKYSIYENGILEIRNITEEDDNDEYMCSARGPQHGYRESIQIKLIFFPQEGNSTLCSGGTETNVNYPVNGTEGNSTLCSGGTETNVNYPVNGTEGNPSQSNGNKCTFWIVLAVIMSVLVLFRVDVKILCRCLLLRFVNKLGNVNPQCERTSDVNHENPTFEGSSFDVRDGEDYDNEENMIPTFESPSEL